MIPYPVIDVRATGERIRQKCLEHDISIPELQEFSGSVPSRPSICGRREKSAQFG